MRILIAGASGFIGSHLRAHLIKEGHEVKTLKRKMPLLQDEIFWDPEKGILDKNLVGDFDAIINLAGEPIMAFRWSEEKKKRILNSRVQAAKTLSQIIKTLKNPPKLFISASATGFYGNQGDRALTEESPKGEGFLAEVCQKWEEAALLCQNSVRVIIPRIGLVLSRDGGALKQMLPIFHLGLGGRIGSGNQWISWIQLKDLLSLFSFFLKNPHAQGIYNAVSPNPVTNQIFTLTLAEVLKRPAILPAPAWFLKLVCGEIAKEAFLASVRALPQKAGLEGFQFQFPDLHSALQASLD